MAIQAEQIMYSEYLGLVPIESRDFGLKLNHSTNYLSQPDMDNQNLELYPFIDSQRDSLRMMLQQHMNQQFTSIFTKYETNAAILMKQKDDEISMANIKSLELEQILRKMEMENQELQKVAMHNEEIVVHLINTLSEIEDHQKNVANACQDAGSCCEDRLSESRTQSRDIGICRRCKSLTSSVIFLPCRHLCSCYACEPFMSSCPVCKLTKKSSIPVFI